jgi:hypothetical protein
MLMNAVPLVLYAIACVRYAMQFARRSFNVSRAASTWLTGASGKAPVIEPYGGFRAGISA